jgi:hypothetical protein
MQVQMRLTYYCSGPRRNILLVEALRSTDPAAASHVEAVAEAVSALPQTTARCRLQPPAPGESPPTCPPGVAGSRPGEAGDGGTQYAAADADAALDGDSRARQTAHSLRDQSTLPCRSGSHCRESAAAADLKQVPSAQRIHTSTRFCTIC